MAIRVMREDPTQETQARVVEEIMKARFLAPVVLEAMPFTVGSNRTSFRDRCRMKFLSIHDGKGNRFSLLLRMIRNWKNSSWSGDSRCLI